jgi:hypothetical protein
VSRAGDADAARKIQDLYLAGHVQEAAAAVPDELLKRRLVGDGEQDTTATSAIERGPGRLLSLTPIAAAQRRRSAWPLQRQTGHRCDRCFADGDVPPRLNGGAVPVGEVRERQHPEVIVWLVSLALVTKTEPRS